MKKTIYPIIAILFVSLSACGGKIKKDETPHRFLDELIDKKKPMYVFDRSILFTEYRLAKGWNNDTPIFTYEFSDSSLSASPWRYLQPYFISLNVVDSFYLVSTKSELLDTIFNIDLLLRIVERAKRTFPEAEFDTAGVVPGMRNSTWIASFEKVCYPDGVQLKSKDKQFTYFIPYGDLTPQEPDNYVSFASPETILPPFLFYSIEDFKKYFDE